MYESGHSPSMEDLRGALLRLEEVLTDHEGSLLDGGGSDAIAGALRKDLEMMREEADRLRALLAAR